MDAFEILGLGRKLEISEEDLREAFREAGKRVHPDAGGSDQEFGEVQRAFGELLSPSRRLRHWLELQGLEVEGRGSVAGSVSDLFGPVGEVIQQAGELERKKAAASSALAQAMLEDELQQTREAVEQAIGQVEGAIGEACGRFPDFEAAAGDPAAAEASEQAGQTVRTLAFLEKWRIELRASYANLAV